MNWRAASEWAVLVDSCGIKWQMLCFPSGWHTFALAAKHTEMCHIWRFSSLRQSCFLIKTKSSQSVSPSAMKVFVLNWYSLVTVKHGKSLQLLHSTDKEYIGKACVTFKLMFGRGKNQSNSSLLWLIWLLPIMSPFKIWPIPRYMQILPLEVKQPSASLVKAEYSNFGTTLYAKYCTQPAP